MANENGYTRKILAFNEHDFRHRKVLEILNVRPRAITDTVVNAVLHFVSCPNAESEFNKAAMKELVREVIAEMQADGSLGSVPRKAVGPAFSEEDTMDLGGMMDVFRR